MCLQIHPSPALMDCNLHTATMQGKSQAMTRFLSLGLKSVIGIPNKGLPVPISSLLVRIYERNSFP